MAGLLRCIGLLNAAIWLGGVVFFVWFAEPATASHEMLTLIGAKNHPYFSVAIGQLLATRMIWLYFICGLVALLHLGAEWLYLGRYPRRFWLGLLAGLLLIGALQGAWWQPRMRELHRLQATRPEVREKARQSLVYWRRFVFAARLVSIVGLCGYCWRMANPPPAPFFLSTSKFRS